MPKQMECVNRKTGEKFKATVYSINEQIHYCAQRSKKGTKDREGNLLKDFRRGQYFGRAQGLSQGARMVASGKYKVKPATKEKYKVYHGK